MSEYKQEISQILQTKASNISLYWKGRVGLFALLQAMEIGKGDEVILPAFTCVVVPNAILYLGAIPIYVDINPDTFNTDLQKIKEKTTDKTRCIIIQNTFGLSSEIEEIVSFGREHNIPTIEDCTHGFGGTYNSMPNGIFADAAFYSTQWNKPFSTGIGGFVFTQNEELSKKLESVNKGLIIPSFKEKTMLSLLIKARKWLLNPATYWFLLKSYRFLSKKGIVVGSSSGEEITGVTMPSDYFKGSSSVQEKFGIKSIKKLAKNLAIRKSNALAINTFLKKNSKTYIKEELISNHSFLKYPILVKDREEFKEKAEKASINLGDWFVSMIHPITDNFENWKLKTEKFPVAQKVSSQMLNLDTDSKNIAKTIEFLQKNLEDIL